MKLVATIERYNNNRHEYDELEVEFNNVKEYRVDEYFLIVITEDGKHHATKASEVIKFSFTE